MKRFAFISMSCKIKDCTNQLFTEHPCGDDKLMNLQQVLKGTYNDFKNLDATEENCRKFWNSLMGAYDTFDNRDISPYHKKCLKEIREWLGKIGNEIAFLSIRKNRNAANPLKTDKLAAERKRLILVRRLVNAQEETVIDAYLSLICFLLNGGSVSDDEALKNIAYYENLTDEELLENAKNAQIEMVAYQ